MAYSAVAPYRGAVERLPGEACFLLDRAGRYLAWNAHHERALRSLTGRPPSRGEPVGSFSADRVPTPDAERRLRELGSGLHAAVGRTLELRRAEFQSPGLLERVQLEAVEDESGEIAGILGIHPIMHGAELLPPRPDPRQEELSRLAGGIINELNNLELALAETVAEGRPPTPADLAGFRGRLALGRRLAEVIGARTRRRESGDAVDLSTLVTQAEATLRPVLGATHLSVETSPQRFEVVGDARDLTLALEELLRNAVEAGARHVTIRIRPPTGDEIWPAPTRPYVRLEVDDDGEGPSSDRLSRVFEPFVGSRRNTPGVGLTRVRAIAEAHGGTVELLGTSAGARAVLRLPVREAPRTAPPRPASLRPDPTQREVLVVDDAPEVRRLLARVLKHAGHRVFEAEDGLDALQKLEERGNLPDAVVLDLMMPRMDGVETYLALRVKSQTLPVLIVSGYHESSLSFLTADRCADFLAKPFRPADLLEKLDQLLTVPAE